MKPALLLVDLQNDYLRRQDLLDEAGVLVERCTRLLHACRRLPVPVVHAQTVIRPDGSNRMPHWKEAGLWACVEGTEGAAPPPSLAPVTGEPVVEKSFYSAFAGPSLDAALGAMEVGLLVVAGLYLHACIQATVLDAYQRGYEVWVAADAVSPMNDRRSDVSRQFLDGRAASFLDVDQILERLA